MDRRLWLWVLPLFTLTATADDREAIVGVWRYAGEVDTKADGSPAPASALSDTQGFIMYTADGFMSVVCMPRNRTWLAETASIAELRETVSNGNAYAGRYELDPTTHTITHITSVSLEPVYQDKRLIRSYVLEGNTLKLEGTFPLDGQTIHFSITWVRVAPSRK